MIKKLVSKVREWHRRRKVVHAIAQMTDLLDQVCAEPDDAVCTRIVIDVIGILDRLEAAGGVSREDRLELGKQWVRARASVCVEEAYRTHDAKSAAAWAYFLTAA
jgi:hypothetical protein